MRRTLCLGLLALLLPGLAACQAAAPMLSAEPPGALARAADRPAVSPASPAPIPAGPASAAATPQPAARSIIYRGDMTLVVPGITQALEAIRAAAVSLDGYLQEMDASSITVRVPASRFANLISNVERFGEVTSRQIKAQDVTAEMRDLDSRLSNAQQVRDRLLALLEKSGKMEDALKVAAELERVTETIELLKGKIALLSSQAAFSTLRVALNSPLPQKEIVAAIPFAWVRELGSGVLSGQAEKQPDAPRWLPRATRFELPPSYIRYFERDEITEAMSAENVLLRVQRHDNYDGGDLAFWSALCRRSLVENRAIALDQTTDLKLDTGATARIYSGTRDRAGKRVGYLIGVVVNKHRVYTFEAWGPAEPFAKDRPLIEKSIRTLQANP